MKMGKANLSSILFGLLMASFLAWPSASLAIGSFNPTQHELALLPPYCAVKARKNGNDARLPDVQKWMSVLGEGYIDIHHYCDALLLMNRADMAMGNTMTINGYYSRALKDFDYLAGRLPADYLLNPEILLNKGRLLLRMHKDADAVQSFRRSIQLNRKYVPAYAALSDYFAEAGNKAKAKAVVKEGLGEMPKSRALLRRLKELEKAK